LASWSKISGIPGRSAAHDESEFPQNLKGVIAFASTLGLLLQALPCAGFDQMRQLLPATDIRPVQPSEILVAEHAKIHFNRRFVAAQDGIHHKLAGCHG
jgi:hypothetical protein